MNTTASQLTKQRQITRTDFCKFLIKLQDTCDLRANQLATEQVKKYRLQKIHQKLTGNPDSAYEN